MDLEFHVEPTAFLDAAGEYLAADPVRGTVVATNVERLARDAVAGVEPPGGFPRWFLVVREGRRIVGAGMRTAPFEPHPAYVLAMPDEAASALGETLADRGEDVGGINGALPAARTAAEAYAARTGRDVRVDVHTRLFELGELKLPPRAPGRLRPATEADLDLAVAWFEAFAVDAAEQAGGTGEPHPEPGLDPRDVSRRIESGLIWLWEDAAGEVVHLTGHNAPSYGVARIGPVYTPPERRGRGYAGSAVAEVSAQLRDDGARVTLFTDQANPVSNHIYEALGYRAVEDQANIVIE